jgi:hypothetical protein
MISLLGSDHSPPHRFQIYYVYHDQTFHYHFQRTLAHNPLAQIYQSKIYQTRSLQTSSHLNDVDDLDDDEYGDDGRYRNCSDYGY